MRFLEFNERGRKEIQSSDAFKKEQNVTLVTNFAAAHHIEPDGIVWGAQKIRDGGGRAGTTTNPPYPFYPSCPPSLSLCVHLYVHMRTGHRTGTLGGSCLHARVHAFVVVLVFHLQLKGL